MGGFLRRQVVEQPTFIAHVFGEDLVDQFPAGCGECDDPPPAVAGIGAAGDQSVAFEPVDPFGHGPGCDHGVRGELSGCAFEGFTGTPQSGEHVELTLPEPVSAVDGAELFGEVVGEAVEPPDHALRPYVKVRPFAGPGLLDAGDVVEVLAHAITIASMEA